MTDEEFGLLQTCIDAISERISELHYGLAVEYDFNKLTDFLLSTGSPIINSTFDPRVKPVPEDAFWLRVLDDEGRTVATHAERLFMTGDFIELIESGDLWHHVGTPKPVDQPEPEIHRPETHLSGKIAYGGSMWVDKAHRGKGLSLYLPYLSRALFMRNYETDFHAGLVLNTLVVRAAQGVWLRARRPGADRLVHPGGAPVARLSLLDVAGRGPGAVPQTAPASRPSHSAAPPAGGRGYRLKSPNGRRLKHTISVSTFRPLSANGRISRL